MRIMWIDCKRDQIAIEVKDTNSLIVEQGTIPPSTIHDATNSLYRIAKENRVDEIHIDQGGFGHYIWDRVDLLFQMDDDIKVRPYAYVALKDKGVVV